MTEFALNISEAAARPGDVAIVREVYRGGGDQQRFELELERALDAGCQTIIIEPTRLGDETARWIRVGNGLHKSAVLSGLAALLAGAVWGERRSAALPCAALSLACTSLYTISWQWDPCCQYQVLTDSAQLLKLPLHSLSSGSPVVLVRRDDRRRRYLHCVVTIAAVTAACLWRMRR